MLFFKRFLTDKQVEKRYVRFGGTFGLAAYLIPLIGKCVGFDKFFSKWKKWEAEYIRRGFRTFSLDEFRRYVDFGTPLIGLGTKREQNEKPVFYSELIKSLKK